LGLPQRGAGVVAVKRAKDPKGGSCHLGAIGTYLRSWPTYLPSIEFDRNTEVCAVKLWMRRFLLSLPLIDLHLYSTLPTFFSPSFGWLQSFFTFSILWTIPTITSWFQLRSLKCLASWNLLVLKSIMYCLCHTWQIGK
jgi:hypothetical protein